MQTVVRAAAEEVPQPAGGDEDGAAEAGRGRQAGRGEQRGDVRVQAGSCD